MSLRVVAIVAAFAVALPGWTSARAEVSPAVICESDASGRAMSCRDAYHGEDAAPFRRIAPSAETRTGRAPKPATPLLATPAQRAPNVEAGPGYLRSGNTAPVLPNLPSTGAGKAAMATAESTVANPAAAPGSSQKVVTKSTPAAVVAPALADQAPAPKLSAQPAVVTAEPSPTTAATIQPATPAAAVVIARPEQNAANPPTAAEKAAPASNAIAINLLGNREFAALDGSRYTLELANAPSAAPLGELAARLSLDGSVYLVHLRSPGADRWLLAWSDHANQAEARAARQRVPADGAINSGWPRRLAPLQNELVSP